MTGFNFFSFITFCLLLLAETLQPRGLEVGAAHVGWLLRLRGSRGIGRRRRRQKASIGPVCATDTKALFCMATWRTDKIFGHGDYIYAATRNLLHLTTDVH